MGHSFSREGKRAVTTMSTGLENMLKIPGSHRIVRGWRLQGLKERERLKREKNMCRTGVAFLNLQQMAFMETNNLSNNFESL